MVTGTLEMQAAKAHCDTILWGIVLIIKEWCAEGSKEGRGIMQALKHFQLFKHLKDVAPLNAGW